MAQSWLYPAHSTGREGMYEEPQDNRCPYRDLYRVPSEYKSRPLPLDDPEGVDFSSCGIG
jgi:hypothetical protein